MTGPLEDPAVVAAVVGIERLVVATGRPTPGPCAPPSRAGRCREPTPARSPTSSRRHAVTSPPASSDVTPVRPSMPGSSTRPPAATRSRPTRPCSGLRCAPRRGRSTRCRTTAPATAPAGLGSRRRTRRGSSPRSPHRGPRGPPGRVARPRPRRPGHAVLAARDPPRRPRGGGEVRGGRGRRGSSRRPRSPWRGPAAATSTTTCCVRPTPGRTRRSATRCRCPAPELSWPQRSPTRGPGMTRDDSAVVDWLTAPERVPEAIATALRAVRQRILDEAH